MSVLARYFSSRRRLPTSSSSPRREWWSCLCSFRCSVRSAIRLVSSATWASGEPVSVSCRPYWPRMSFFGSAVSATKLTPYPSVRDKTVPCKKADAAAANCSTRRGRRQFISWPARGQNRAGALGVVTHRRHQVLDVGEFLLATDAGDEVHRNVLAVQVGGGIEDERLHGARAPGERRVGAYRDSRLIPLAGDDGSGDRAVSQDCEPCRVHAVGGDRRVHRW